MKGSRVIIMTASFGNGHQSVSHTLKHALKDHYQVDIIDILDLLMPPLKAPIVKGYSLLTKDFKGVYNWFYHYKKEAPNNHLDGMMYRLFRMKFREKMRQLAPDFIISTFPMTSAFVSRYKSETHLELPLITVLTDVVDSWEWLHEGTNRYFVPTHQVKLKLVDKGVNPDIIRVTGVPVEAPFKARTQYAMKAVDDVKSFEVLIMASALSCTPIDDVVLEAFSKMEDVKFTIVTGRDQHLYDCIQQQVEIKSVDNVCVLPYVNKMANLMGKMDLICTKPGGVTLFEVIHMNVPMLVQDTHFGQEEANIHFVEENRIGQIVRNSDEMLTGISRLLYEDKQRSEMVQHMELLVKDMETDYVEALQ